MPVYEYNCSHDDAHPKMSVHRAMTESDPGYTCVECESQMTRLFTTVGVQFKGNGFYKTDNVK